MGYGGSIFQWNPELNIGFAYVPLDCIFGDYVNYKGSFLQQVASDCVIKKRGAAQ